VLNRGVSTWVSSVLLEMGLRILDRGGRPGNLIFGETGFNLFPCF